MPEKGTALDMIKCIAIRHCLTDQIPTFKHVERLGICVTIRRWQLKNWKDDPDGRYSVVRIPTLKGNSYRLGLFYPSAGR